MKRIYNIVIVLFLFFNTGCYKDLGNYDYTPLPEIEVEGVERDYGTMQMFADTLHIEPVVRFGEEDGNSFEAVWYRYTDTILPIANTLDLHIPIITNGTQRFLLELTHKQLKISTRVETSVTANSDMERGFYILKETADGNTELDGHVRTGIETFRYTPDILASKKGEALQGKPIDLDYWDWQYNDFENDTIIKTRVIRPVSEKDIAVLRMTDMDYLGGVPELFLDLEGDMTLEGLKSASSSTVVIYNGGKMRTMKNTDLSRFMLELNGEYEVEPYIMAPREGTNFMVYDNLSSSFLSGSDTKSDLITMPDEAPIGGKMLYLPANNWNADLLWCGRNKLESGAALTGWGSSYVLLQRRQQPDSVFLLHLTLSYLRIGIMHNFSPVCRIDTLQKEALLGKGELFAVHEYEPLIFFSRGSRIFTYNLRTSKEELLVDMAQRFPGFSLSYMRYIQCEYEPKTDYRFDCLFIGMNQGGRYKLLGYKVTHGGDLGEKVFELEGDGSLKDMVYTAPTEISPFYIYQHYCPVKVDK